MQRPFSSTVCSRISVTLSITVANSQELGSECKLYKVGAADEKITEMGHCRGVTEINSDQVKASKVWCHCKSRNVDTGEKVLKISEFHRLDTCVANELNKWIEPATAIDKADIRTREVAQNTNKCKIFEGPSYIRRLSERFIWVAKSVSSSDVRLVVSLLSFSVLMIPEFSYDNTFLRKKG
ncbi:hypothetical protein BCR41DRAFT_371634 [Lobosporangium transversale]|uniref:Uncharacterized protein n=1 Tax=Lobosporangium transversale TaxID=64571 RepID=A0A1Y2GJM8_9FUNG|nr:hypothetical protein BCR41DRAFT_371634 [Lobosporangium transversale]ORZ12941.1 hypothetical protein BCR41DRAFT_371634 [Lobosporangium transversale]|eukprot:XP_021880290.1 hypothetical protein BCR41DRAFT_371634 [Lobosporangium transversale]